MHLYGDKAAKGSCGIGKILELICQFSYTVIAVQANVEIIFYLATADLAIT